MANQLDTDTGLLGSAGARRNQDALGVKGLDFADGDLVVAANFDFGTQFSEVLDEVVGERVVVVENENHRVILAAFKDHCTAEDAAVKGFAKRRAGMLARSLARTARN
jgi:hypothetical protein